MKTNMAIVKPRRATAKLVQDELLVIANRWRRRYPAYLIKSALGRFYNSNADRVEVMHRDIGFLLRLINKALPKV